MTKQTHKILKSQTSDRSYERIAYILQGGGALGAYQLGVIEALNKYGYYPNILSGISIGAINAAIIAGNPKEKFIEKLNGFWDSISTNALYNFFQSAEFLSSVYDELGAASAVLFGQPGFFEPRLENPIFMKNARVDKISFYDMDQLRNTLIEFIDFDLINSQQTQLYLGAVSVGNGELTYFNNIEDTIKPEHVMASAALPPGMSAVKIGNEFYWDGGIYTNTPLSAFLGLKPQYNTLCFSVNCFNAKGPVPTSLEEVRQRIKDIRYSSHSKEYYQLFLQQQNFRCALEHLGSMLPADVKKDPEVKAILADAVPKLINIVNIVYDAGYTNYSYKDFNFARSAIEQHKKAGYKDGVAAVKEEPWGIQPECYIGAVLHEAPNNPK